MKKLLLSSLCCLVTSVADAQSLKLFAAIEQSNRYHHSTAQPNSTSSTSGATRSALSGWRCPAGKATIDWFPDGKVGATYSLTLQNNGAIVRHSQKRCIGLFTQLRQKFE